MGKLIIRKSIEISLREFMKQGFEKIDMGKVMSFSEEGNHE